MSVCFFYHFHRRDVWKEIKKIRISRKSTRHFNEFLLTKAGDVFLFVEPMTCYLAPERPRVFSTITEQFFNGTCFHSNLVSNSSSMLNTRFGQEYENELCFLLAKDAPINTDDEICLIADQPQWATIIEENFFLNKKILFIDSHSSSGRFFFQLLLNMDRSI